jgi:hypothetical protein
MALLTLGCSSGRLDAFDVVDAGAMTDVTSPSTLLIDDFEDGDTQALATDGWWYVVNDGAGEQRFGIEPTSRSGSQLAAHTSGSGFRVWGAALGLDLTGYEHRYDASAFDELRFWARTGATPRDVSVTFLSGTGDHFALIVSLTTEWRQFVAPFAAAFPTEGDANRSLDTTDLEALQFFMLTDAAFDLWLDDVVLARAGSE